MNIQNMLKCIFHIGLFRMCYFGFGGCQNYISIAAINKAGNEGDLIPPMTDLTLMRLKLFVMCLM